MKFNPVLLLSISMLLFCSVGCNSKYQVLNSKSQIANLQNDGCLFVRLHYFPNKIDKLNELGYKKAAVAEQKKIAEANKSLMSAFKKNWDFSSVYFVFPEESLKIKESKFEDINFLNDDLEVDPTIKCTCENILLVEKGRIQKTKPDENDSAKQGESAYFSRSTTYYTDSSQPIQGLIVKSNEFVQLHKPFPFYTRRYKLLFRRNDEAMVKELNENFNIYYKHINNTQS